MDPIKEAFQKAKQDIVEIRSQIINLSNQIEELKILISSIQQTNQQTNIPTQNPTDYPTNSSFNTTFPEENPTDKLNEPSKQPHYGLKSSNLSISTRNEGVPTNKQTNQQTNRQEIYLDKSTPEQIITSRQVRLSEVSRALQSIDILKEDLKTQFKHLTKQEFLFFCTVYQLEEEGFTVDYPLLSSKLGLSESSMRDYTLKIIRKGLPLVKTKQDNKKVLLSISPDLRKIAPLSTILSLK